MVRLKPALNILITPAKNFFRKTFASKSNKLLAVLVLVILFLGGFIISTITTRGSCDDLIDETGKLLNNPRGPEDYKIAYKELEKNKACQQTGGFIGLGTDNDKNKVQELQHYYNKARAEYVRGEKDKSKADAEKGLSISSQLSEKDKQKLTDYMQIVQELKDIKDGVF